MNLRERKKLYRAAVQKWGLTLQMGMLMEESAELIQATHKVMRTDMPVFWDHLAEEMADVEIMIEQISTMVDWQDLKVKKEQFKLQKLERLKERTR